MSNQEIAEIPVLPAVAEIVTCGRYRENGRTLCSLQMSNCYHTIDRGLAKILRTGKHWCKHYGYNFCGDVWFEGGLFWEEVYVYHQPRATISAKTLKGLMKAVNDQFGWD